MAESHSHIDRPSCFPAREEFRRAAARVLEQCDELAACSEDPHRLTRTFCSGAMRRAHDRVRRWMHAAGMTTRMDALGNLIGRMASGASGSRVFLIGSHLDTVVDAGRYDGLLGVLLGVAAVQVLRESETALPYSLDVIGFSEEEGVRFSTPFLGSRAVAGLFEARLFELTDTAGCTVRQALVDFGACPDALGEARYGPGQLLGYLEPHIEQGPILDHEQRPTGVVSAVAGQTRATFEFVGRAGHAGTVPLPLRHDALAAAAEFITRVESLAQQTAGLFATVGQISVAPNVSNVIPGQARVRLDLRHEHDHARLNAFERIQRLAAASGDRRGVTVSVGHCEQQSAVAMDDALTEHLQTASREAGVPTRRLVSGAGHDAVMLAQVAPAAILFIRCREGISHHPDESVNREDVATALEVILRFLIRLGGHTHHQTKDLGIN